MAIGLSSYIAECLMNKITPELILMPNVFYSNDRKRSSSSYCTHNDELNYQRQHTNSTVSIGNSFKNKMTKSSLEFPSNESEPKKSFKLNVLGDEKKRVTFINNKILGLADKTETNLNPLLKAEFNNTNQPAIDNDENFILNKNLIKNIAFFNPDLIKFSELRGLRNRNFTSISNDAKVIDLKVKELSTMNFISSENALTPALMDSSQLINNEKLDFERTLQLSIEKKLNDEIDKNKSNENILEVDVDKLIQEKRSRSKGFRIDRSNTPVKSSNYCRTRNMSMKGQNKGNLENQYELDNTKLEEYIDLMNSNISLKSICRPFNICLHMINLGNTLNNNYEIFYETPKRLNLEIEVQIYCGMDPVSQSHKIYWKGISNNVTALIRNRLTFDIKYSNLPLISSLIFKIRTTAKSSSDKTNKIEKKTIAWVNFRILDHLKKLKTGMQKVSLWGTKFSDDSYFTYSDNFKENNGELFFELESFMRPVEYKNKEIEDEKSFISGLLLSISYEDNLFIEKIEKKSPFEELTDDEKFVLWRNRNTLMTNCHLVPKILSCVNAKEIGNFSEIDKLLSISKPVPAIIALQLLSGKFLHDSIRFFAVYSLQQVSFIEISEYLPQLVQCLKYEMYHDSTLANFLLKIAIKYPLKIGHQLFWLLKAEISNSNVQQRFGLYLQIFLNKVGSDIRKIFQDEIWLINKLLILADSAFIKNKTEEEKNILLRENLEKLNGEFKGRSISIAYNFKLRVKGFIVEKCKYLKSKKKPMWLIFKSSDECGEDICVIFKKGDDLRQDIITLQLFKIMNNIWYKEGIKLNMSIYNVISTGFYQGMLEIVKNSETLADVHREHKTLGLSDKALKYWMVKNITKLSEVEYVNNFLLSCAAYCVATFVLGIGDRHNDNIMMKKNGEIFHIDFGHFLGHFKYKFGIKRERAPFVFTTEFLNVLGGEKGTNKFKELCIKSYQILRKESGMLVAILKVMLCTGIPELTNSSIKFLEYSLALKMNDMEAEKFLLEKLEKSLNSLSTKFNFAIHILANK